jgi:hypothetical protein
VLKIMVVEDAPLEEIGEEELRIQDKLFNGIE